MRLWLIAAAIAACAFVVGVLLGVAGASADSWSAPVVLSTCGPASAPKVVFPFSAPDVRSGAGAILWVGPAGGCSGVGTGRTTIEVASIDGSDGPGAPRSWLGGAAAAMRLSGPLDAVGTTAGEVIAVAGASDPSGLGEAGKAGEPAYAAEGYASGQVDSLRAMGGSDSLVATMNGFIGDADVATVGLSASGEQEILIRAQRHFAKRFNGRHHLTIGPGRVGALVLGMDYRADRLVIWAQDGDVWAQYVTNRGHAKARQLLGPSGYDPQIAAVLSDDDRAFVVWTDEPPPGTSGVTTVFLAHSAIGPRFHGALPLTSFTEPAGVRLGAGTVAAERLSNEGVALLWPAMANGNYVVEAAGATETGVLSPSVISEPGQDVRLGAVATGPDNEIVVLVEVAPRTTDGFDLSDEEILATRSNVVRAKIGLGFGPLAQLAAGGPNIDPSVAVDPDTDTAVAAWQTSVAGTAQVEYAIGSGAGVGG